MTPVWPSGVTEPDRHNEQETNMLLTKTKSLLEAQRDASRKVAQGKKYSVDLPILGRVMVPPPEQLAIYAALGGLAVLELIDWPVALAMGVGSALVSRHLSELEAREDELAEAIEPTAEDIPQPSTATASPPPAATTTARTTPSRKAPAPKAAAKPVAKKPVAKKAVSKKAAAKKAVAKKAAAKKAPAKAAPRASAPTE
jgi:hypothetical protein